jgi:hypothetical protein
MLNDRILESISPSFLQSIIFSQPGSIYWTDLVLYRPIFRFGLGQTTLSVIMGERKSKVSSKSSKLARSRTVTSLQRLSSSSNAKLVRCPEGILERLRGLNEAEVITLFTPFVPHSPSTSLMKDMDPFEPLGRALPRQVRHVPYRLDSGMTELHSDFLPASGAVVVVVCVTSNIVNSNPRAFEQQVNFARSIRGNIVEIEAISGVPTILLLVSNGAVAQAYADAMQDFPALVMVDDYTTSALANVVRVLFQI